MKPNIYCSITTLTGWREKLEEAGVSGLAEAAVFLTGLPDEPEIKKEFYARLQASPIKYVPLVHLRSDTAPEEIELFMNKYGSRTFNLHLEDKYPLVYDWTRWRQFLYVENTGPGFQYPEMIGDYAGVCADWAHLENARLNDPAQYAAVRETMEKYPIGCAHISAVMPTPRRDKGGQLRNDEHYYRELSDFDYLREYVDYLPAINAIELNESLARQMAVRDYLIDLLVL